jgi:hypothetical protein
MLEETKVTDTQEIDLREKLIEKLELAGLHNDKNVLIVVEFPRIFVIHVKE